MLLATFNIDYTISGEIIITITSQNFFPYQNNIVINQSPNQIMLDTDNILIIEDGSSNTVGNGNNMINPGEIVQSSSPVSLLPEESSVFFPLPSSNFHNPTRCFS